MHYKTYVPKKLSKTHVESTDFPATPDLAVVPRQHRHGSLPQLTGQALRQCHSAQRLGDVGAGADAAGTHGA